MSVEDDRLTAAAEGCGWPRVELGTLVVAGESAWRSIIQRAHAAGDRRILLAALVGVSRRLLVASEGGRARLRAWLDGARRATESPAALRERIRDELLFYGDKELLPVAVEGFARAPAPVRDVLLGQVAVLAVGATTNAWTAPSRMVDRDDRPRARIIVIHGHERTFPELLQTFEHELGHNWHVALPADHDMNITALGLVGLADYAAENGLSDHMEAQKALSERLADACAIVWLSA